MIFGLALFDYHLIKNNANTLKNNIIFVAYNNQALP